MFIIYQQGRNTKDVSDSFKRDAPNLAAVIKEVLIRNDTT